MEKNRDILKNALNDLPSKKAGASGWEDISGSLDQLEAKDFLRNNLEKLPEHRAPAGAWKGIEKALPASVFSWSSSALIKWSSGILAGVVLLSGLFILLPEEEKENTETVLQEKEAVMQQKLQPEKPQALSLRKESQTKGSETSYLDKKKKNKGGNPDHDPAVGNQITIHDAVTNELSGYSPAEQPTATSVLDQESTRKQVFGMQTIGARNIQGLKMRKPSLSTPAYLSVNPEFGDYYRDKKRIDFSLAAFYSLINFQNVEVQNMEIPESVSSFGLEFMLEKQSFYLKSGLAYLSWEEKAVYDFEYRKNELVYSYNYVDSAHVDPNSGNINYFTSPRDIYDSVDHLQPDQVRYRYRVLQVPLVLGYKVFENKKLKFNVFAGVGGDFRIGGREYRPVLDRENSSIISEVNYLDYRFSVNWRILGGLSLQYRISDKWSFYVEPSYQQYLKSVYRESGLKKASYIEIKSGIMFKF